MIHRERFGRYSLTLDGRGLSALRVVLREDLREAGFPPEATQLVLLSVEELAANVAEHGYGNRPGGPLRIRMDSSRTGRVEIGLEDRAPPVSWADLPRHDLAELAARHETRGRGIALMERLAESIRHRALDGGGNRWTMIFDAAALQRWEGNGTDMHTEGPHLVSVTRLHADHGREVTEIAFRGSVRSETVDLFRDGLEMAGDQSAYLLVNLSDVEYLCSTGLGSLLAQSRRQEKRTGWVRILSPSPTVRMILSLSGVSDILVSADTPGDALRDLPEAA